MHCQSSHPHNRVDHNGQPTALYAFVTSRNEGATQLSAFLPLTWTVHPFRALEAWAGCNLFAGSSRAAGGGSMAT